MANRLSKEERQKTQQMDIESLAKFVFRYLKEAISGPLRASNFFSVVNLRTKLFPGEPQFQSHDDHVKLLEAIGLLERRGLVVRDSSRPPSTSYSPNKPTVYVYLTSIGMKSNFDDGIEFLVDKPQEIVNKLEDVTGPLDGVVRHYYLESIRANQEELYISSVICLGAASERSIHWLAEAIESYSEKYREQIEKRRYGEISRLIEYLSNSVIPNIFDKNNDLKGLLDTLGDICRKNRNEAGHPKTVDQSWSTEDQRLLLSEFRKYITTICKAIAECRANNKPTTANG